MAEKWTATPFGLKIQIQNFILFFGNRNSQIQNLEKHFSEFQFQRVKQIHSADVVEISEKKEDFFTQADGIITAAKNMAVCSITADCCPVLIFCDRTQRISAVHAGWKGVATSIVPNAIQKLKELGCATENLHVFIGPHIETASFEIEENVALEILKSISATPEDWIHSSSTPYFQKGPRSDRFYLNLTAVLQTQLKNLSVPESHVHSTEIDTVRTLNYHSFRRDKDQSGRQISFIAKL